MYTLFAKETKEGLQLKCDEPGIILRIMIHSPFEKQTNKDNTVVLKDCTIADLQNIVNEYLNPSVIKIKKM